MSEPIPESIPTSADPRSKRPLKKRALTPATAQASQISHLFSNPTAALKPVENGLALSTDHSPTGNGTGYQPPEIVTNVQGSSAGAGSGEFHVYKASRRREYERLRAMDEEVRRESEQEKYERERAEREARDREATEKKRRKREKMKARKGKKGAGGGEAAEDEAPVGPKVMPRVVQRTEEGQDNVGVEGAAATETVPEEGLIIHDDD
jgi:hypothetical protein